ncbi:MAG TPA: ferrous iron transport protein A [Candidatus Limiplasma pullicola]|nr:ferrous iron transport protein A [Candidatus Limiplasma pullicola]
MEQAFTLDRLESGESACVVQLTGTGAMQSRLCDLGFTENSRVTCLFSSVFGDPRAYRVRDTVVALRSGDARTVLCRADGGAR